ncbi:hypothetical protein BDQ94DRAFT_140741 [Aspergillus welwitschiae]|uniref:Uncharacterized protein n=1 Tax=Aspergillus welwitschiae TaxID=1341132 RepID=A0A3F3Q634_9EURO|nr:hypothetical protein BDQ94DRAFT_140741 [Aspergillus welwitschiae]RDH34684.1 hypothetical protein BDQ94DRAFT_140741 [Aspergillus welwitschiae]
MGGAAHSTASVNGVLPFLFMALTLTGCISNSRLKTSSSLSSMAENKRAEISALFLAISISNMFSRPYSMAQRSSVTLALIRALELI